MVDLFGGVHGLTKILCGGDSMKNIALAFAVIFLIILSSIVVFPAILLALPGLLIAFFVPVLLLLLAACTVCSLLEEINIEATSDDD